MGGEVHRREVEHEVGDHGADEATGELSRDERRRVWRRHGACRPLDSGDDRVERCRDRLQRQDQRGQHGAGDDAVLQQLQPGVRGGQPYCGDAGADHRGDEEGGPDELGKRAPAQRGHGAALPISVARPLSASALAR